MILLLLFIVMLAALVGFAYLLGFRLGGQHWQDELLRVRLESVSAQRQMHDLTRQAFVAMVEHAEQQRRP